MTRRRVLLSLMAALLIGAGPRDSDVARTRGLDGVWLLIGMEEDGVLDDARRMQLSAVIRGESVELRRGNRLWRKCRFDFRHDLQPTAIDVITLPSVMDEQLAWTAKKSAERNASRGLYALQADRLRLVFRADQERPKNSSTVKGSGQWSFVFVRISDR
jgi:uncharacterized protein (TIGR03067 family)